MTDSPSASTARATARFGFGLRPGEAARIGADGRAWLLDQIARPGSALLSDPRLASSADAVAALNAYREQQDAERRAAGRGPAPDRRDPPDRGNRAAPMTGDQPMAPAAPEPRPAFQPPRRLQALLFADSEARVHRAVTTGDGFSERWVQFWSNHFTVAARSLPTLPWPGVFEREAVRPRVFGRFADLLKASVLHPGMLVYLDQHQSVGPGSQLAQRAARRAGPDRDPPGLNENLAREVLELHTIGAQAGYGQADVTEFARALTGWTVPVAPRLQRLARDATPGSAVFIDALHEPGQRTLLGRSWRETGAGQATAILDHLASHPATAGRIALKVARHFVADEPPPALVTRLEADFRRSGGDLASLARTLVTSPEAIEPEARKFKTPNDFLVSSLRAAGVTDLPRAELRATFEQLGQIPYRAPSPRGWADTASEWAAPDAVLKRAEWAQLVAGLLPAGTDPSAFATGNLGPALTARTATALRRAGSARQAISLFLMSPEFQRR